MVMAPVALALGGRRGPVEFDAQATAQAKSTATGTVSITIASGRKRKILVGIQAADTTETLQTLSSLTFDPGGAHQTSGAIITGGSDSLSGGGTTKSVSTGYVDVPDTVPAGAYDVDVSLTGSLTDFVVGAIALKNAATGQPEAVAASDSGGSASSISPSITTLTDEAMVVELLVGPNANLTPDDGQTERFDVVNTDSTFHAAGAATFAATASLVNTGWSSSSSAGWVHVAASVASG